MNREKQQANKWYDALMFAHTTQEARQAARELVRVVLGDEEAEQRPLEEALREVCREIRPAEDSRDQARFEEEFLELVNAPTGASAAAMGSGRLAA